MQTRLIACLNLLQKLLCRLLLKDCCCSKEDFENTVRLTREFYTL